MLTEEEFWKRYVQSKFNERNRGNVSMTIKDEIFDKCWDATEEGTAIKFLNIIGTFIFMCKL